MSNYLIFNKIKNYLNTLRLQTEKKHESIAKQFIEIAFKARYSVCHHYR